MFLVRFFFLPFSPTSLCWVEWTSHPKQSLRNWIVLGNRWKFFPNPTSPRAHERYSTCITFLNVIALVLQWYYNIQLGQMKTPILSDLTCHANVHSYVMQVLSTEVSPNRFQEQPPHKKYSPILYSWRITVLFFWGAASCEIGQRYSVSRIKVPKNSGIRYPLRWKHPWKLH